MNNMSPENSGKTRLDIKLVGNDHKSTQRASQQITEFFKNNQCRILAIVKLPIKQSFIYSIRRCHFIYKESREQFAIRRHKICIFVEFSNDKTNDLREKVKKVQVPADVRVSMKVITKKEEDMKKKVLERLKDPIYNTVVSAKKRS